jgi:hypothetical protein
VGPALSAAAGLGPGVFRACCVTRRKSESNWPTFRENESVRTLLVSPFLAIALSAAAQIGATFPAYPPAPDADPNIRHSVELSVPVRLSVQRIPTSLSVAYELDSVRNVKITVGKNMIVGMKDEFRVYRQGDTRPLSYRSLLETEVKENNGEILLSDTHFLQSLTLSSDRDGIPAAGMAYTIEHYITLFETDLPAQHMWSPERSKNYKVLWEEKLNIVR